MHYIRSDWYPELGIAEDPKTVDEFADFLRAVVSGDPNGNGKADEIGWTNFMSAGFPRMWLTSFGIDTFNHFPWTDINYGVENGSDVYFAPTSDRYKAMIDWIGKMFREGCSTLTSSTSIHPSSTPRRSRTPSARSTTGRSTAPT